MISFRATFLGLSRVNWKQSGNLLMGAAIVMPQAIVHKPLRPLHMTSCLKKVLKNNNVQFSLLLELTLVVSNSFFCALGSLYVWPFPDFACLGCGGHIQNREVSYKHHVEWLENYPNWQLEVWNMAKAFHFPIRNLYQLPIICYLHASHMVSTCLTRIFLWNSSPFHTNMQLLCNEINLYLKNSINSKSMAIPDVLSIDNKCYSPVWPYVFSWSNMCLFLLISSSYLSQAMIAMHLFCNI